MQVATLTATLEAQIAAFESNMRAADKITQDMRAALAGLEKQSVTTSRELVASGKEIAATSKATASQVSAAAEMQVSSAKKQIIAEVAKRQELAKTATEARAAAAAATQGSNEWVAATTVQLAAEKKLAAGVAAASAAMAKERAAALRVTSAPAFGGGFVVKGEGGKFLGSTANVEAMKLSEAEQARLTELIKQTTTATTTGIESEVTARAEQARQIEGTISKLTALRSEQEEGSKEWLAANQMIIASEKELQAVIGETAATAEKIVEAGVKQRTQLAELAAEYRALAQAAVAGSDEQIVAASLAVKAEHDLSSAVISATKLIEEQSNAIQVTGTVTQQAAALNIKANLAQQDTLLALIAEYEAVAAASVVGSREQVAASTLAKKAQSELNGLLAVTTKEVKDASAVQVSAASKAIAAGVKQREELAALVAEYHVVADTAAQGSNTQIVAANLAADAEKRLQAQLAAVAGEQSLSIAQIAAAKIAANAAEQESLRSLIAEYEAAANAGNLSADEQRAATDLVTAAQRRLNVAIKTGAGENAAAAASAAVKNEELAAIRAGRGLAAGIGGPGRALAFGSTAFITGIIGALSIRAVVGAATQEEQALKLLQNAMRNNGESWKEWGATVQKSVGALSIASKFTKEDLFKGLLQLDLATKNVSVAQKDLGIAVNLSRQKQIDLSTAVRDVVLVSEGHASILRRQGIVLPQVTSAEDKLKRMLAGVAAAGEKVTTSSKQHATALAKQSDLAATGALDMRELEQRVRGADAAFAETTSGHMAAFHKALNDLAVAVGEGVIPVMNRVIERFDKWASNAHNVQAAANGVKQVFSDIVGAAKYFGDAIGLIDRATGSFKNTVIALVGLKLGFWVMSSVMNFKELFAVMKAGSFSSVLISVTLLTLAIGALSKVFPGVKGAAKTMAVGLAALFVAIKLGWFDTMTAMVVSATGASTAIGVAFAATGVGAIIIGFAVLAEVVVFHWKQVKHFFVELWRDLKVGWEHMWLWLKIGFLKSALAAVEPFSHLPSFLGGWARKAKNSLLANMDSVRASMGRLGTSSGTSFGEGMYKTSVAWEKAVQSVWDSLVAPSKGPRGPRGPTGASGAGPNGDLQGPVGAPTVHLKLPQKIMDMVTAAEAGHGSLTKADAAAYAFYEKQLQQPGISAKQKRALYQAEAPYVPAAAYDPNLKTYTTAKNKNILPVAQRIALDKALKEQAAVKPAVLADANTAQLRKWIEANEVAAEQAGKALGWLKEQHFTGEKLTKSLQLQKQLLNDITAAHRNIAAAMKAEVKAQEKAHVDAVNAKAMKILGIGPGGQPVLPGVTSLMGSERSTLISAAEKLVKSETKGKGGLSADQIANLEKLSLPKLIETVKKMGVDLPKSTLESLRKINEVFALALKEHVKLTSDVLTDLRDRLSQIKKSILASLSNGASIQNAYAGVTAASLIAGIKGLTPEQKLELEQRYAQSIAHGGRVPKGVAVQGIPVPAGGTATGPKSSGGGRGPNKPKYAFGGVAPGSGMGDTVPAWLTPGEIILNGQHQSMLRKALGVEGGGPEHLFRALTGGMSRYMSRDPEKFAAGGVAHLRGSRGEVFPFEKPRRERMDRDNPYQVRGYRYKDQFLPGVYSAPQGPLGIRGLFSDLLDRTMDQPRGWGKAAWWWDPNYAPNWKHVAKHGMKLAHGGVAPSFFKDGGIAGFFKKGFEHSKHAAGTAVSPLLAITTRSPLFHYDEPKFRKAGGDISGIARSSYTFATATAAANYYDATGQHAKARRIQRQIIDPYLDAQVGAGITAPFAAGRHPLRDPFLTAITFAPFLHGRVRGAARGAAFEPIRFGNRHIIRAADFYQTHAFEPMIFGLHGGISRFVGRPGGGLLNRLMRREVHPGQAIGNATERWLAPFGFATTGKGNAGFLMADEKLPEKVMYHVAPTRDRLRIKAGGLRLDVPRRHAKEPLGNYLWASKEQAWKYATRGSGLGDVDIWAVKGGFHRVEKDPFFLHGPMWAETARQRREILETAKQQFGEDPGAYIKRGNISRKHLSLNEAVGGFANPWFTDKQIAEHMNQGSTPGFFKNVRGMTRNASKVFGFLRDERGSAEIGPRSRGSRFFSMPGGPLDDVGAAKVRLADAIARAQRSVHTRWIDNFHSKSLQDQAKRVASEMQSPGPFAFAVPGRADFFTRDRFSVYRRGSGYELTRSNLTGLGSRAGLRKPSTRTISEAEFYRRRAHIIEASIKRSKEITEIEKYTGMSFAELQHSLNPSGGPVTARVMHELRAIRTAALDQKHPYHSYQSLHAVLPRVSKNSARRLTRDVEKYLSFWMEAKNPAGRHPVLPEVPGRKPFRPPLESVFENRALVSRGHHLPSEVEKLTDFLTTLFHSREAMRHAGMDTGFVSSEIEDTVQKIIKAQEVARRLLPHRKPHLLTDLHVPDFGNEFSSVAKLVPPSYQTYTENFVKAVNHAVSNRDYKFAHQMITHELQSHNGVGNRAMGFSSEIRKILEGKLEEVNAYTGSAPKSIHFHDLGGFAVDVPDSHAFVQAVENAIENGNLQRANTLLRKSIRSGRWGSFTPVLSKKLLEVDKMIKDYEPPARTRVRLPKGTSERIADEATKYLEFWEMTRRAKPHSKEAESAEGVAHALHLKLRPLFPKSNAGAIRNRVTWPFNDRGGASLPQEMSVRAVKNFLAGKHNQKAIDTWIRMAMRNRNSAGGVITDGNGTGDDVPALLSRGEIVLNRRQQENLRRMAGLKHGSPAELFNQVNLPSSKQEPPDALSRYMANHAQLGNAAPPDALSRYMANHNQVPQLDDTARSLLPYLPPTQQNRPDPYGRYWASSVPGGNKSASGANTSGRATPPVAAANAASSRCCSCETVHIGSVEINVNGSNKNPAEIAREVRAELIRNARRNSTQTRGPNAGRNTGLS